MDKLARLSKKPRPVFLWNPRIAKPWRKRSSTWRRNPNADDRWEPADGNISSTNFPAKKRRRTTSLCLKGWACNADLRMSSYDCQGSGKRHGGIRSAIGRGLGCTSGYEQYVASHHW